MRLFLALVLVAITSISYGQKTYIPKLRPNVDKTKGVDIGDTTSTNSGSSASTKTDSTISGFKYRPALFVKHIQGVKSVDAFYTNSKDGMGFKACFSHFVKRDIYLQYGFEYENGTVGYSFFEDFTGTGAIAYSPFNINNRVYFNGITSLHLGHELLIMTENRNQKSNFLYEVGLGLETEAFITPQIALSGIFSQKLFSSSLLGNFYYEAEVGIKYIFR